MSKTAKAKKIGRPALSADGPSEKMWTSAPPSMVLRIVALASAADWSHSKVIRNALSGGGLDALEKRYGVVD